MIVVSVDGGAPCGNGGFFTLGLRKCGPARGYCRLPVEKELSDLRWQVNSLDSNEWWRGVVIVCHGDVGVVLLCSFYSCFYV